MQETDTRQSTDEPDADDATNEYVSGETAATSVGPADPYEEPISRARHAAVFGSVVVVVLTALSCWLGVRFYHSQQERDRHNEFLQVARQGALNLTTIDWQHADADVRRIVDGATGEFHEDFVKRSQPFIDAVQQSKAKTVGSVVEAGLESETTDTARALVAVSVQTSNAAGPDQVQRSWRLRIDVQRVEDQVKVSNVQFVL